MDYGTLPFLKDYKMVNMYMIFEGLPVSGSSMTLCPGLNIDLLFVQKGLSVVSPCITGCNKPEGDTIFYVPL